MILRGGGRGDDNEEMKERSVEVTMIKGYNNNIIWSIYSTLFFLIR